MPPPPPSLFLLLAHRTLKSMLGTSGQNMMPLSPPFIRSEGSLGYAMVYHSDLHVFLTCGFVTCDL